MSRKPLLAGNWKMFKTSAQAREFFADLIKLTQFKADREVAFGVPFPTLEASVQAAHGTPVIIAAQDVYWENEGAFTGEVSAPMIAATGAGAVIIGHSERRQMFGDTGEWVNKKVKATLAAKLMPIVCVGESLAEREANKTFDVLDTQLTEGLAGFTPADMTTVVIAYEPVWAIGTGKTATPEMAEEVHAHIRKWLAGRFDQAVADNTRILYGGSVKPDNVAKLMSQADIDGALVGGASLEAASFAKIIDFDA
ncbi:triose-phosphate isomerase [Deltaproteobacteria bacterium Smac51]|nr:triose-phosphate isomerase [Deltaproteobacteria bacterium Smac51]